MNNKRFEWEAAVDAVKDALTDYRSNYEALRSVLIEKNGYDYFFDAQSEAIRRLVAEARSAGRREIAKAFFDHEPESDYDSAESFRKHLRYGGTREDY